MKARLLNRLTRRLNGAHRTLERIVYSQWYKNPICPEPVATRDAYLRLAGNAKEQQYPEIELFEQNSGFRINPDWLHSLALHTQVIKKSSPICYAHGRVLYSSLSRYLAEHPSRNVADRITIFETGTSRGFSALCMAKALDDQHRAGTIITFDVLPHNAAMYWNCIDDCDRGQLTRRQLLAPWKNFLSNYVVFVQGDTRIELPKVQTERVNFAFLDGAHTYDDVIFEFEQIKDLQQSGDMIVYDDYTEEQFPGLVAAVDHICAKYQYTRVDISAHARRGYVIARKM